MKNKIWVFLENRLGYLNEYCNMRTIFFKGKPKETICANND